MENQKLEVIFEILYGLDEAKIETNLYDKITKLEAVHQRAYSISQHYPKGDVYSKIMQFLATDALCEKEEPIAELEKQQIA